jgi:hypothetical protein
MLGGRIGAVCLLVVLLLAPLELSCAAPAPAVQVRTVVVEKAVEKQVVVITTPTRPLAGSGEAAPGTATSTPARCVDGMARVRDLTLDDRGMTAPPEVAPGQRFVKGWKVRNIGTCAWDETYALAFVQGNSPLAEMGGSPVTMDAPVPPGSEHDVYVELVAPQAPGAYQGFWQLRNGQGIPFGERVWVGVNVPAPPKPPPLPPATPLPDGTFMADRANIATGSCVTLTWSFENIQEIHFAVQDRPDTSAGVMGQDSRRECPAESTVYELQIIHLDGSPEVRRIPIAVAGSLLVPTSVRFTIDPETRIRAGQCVQLSWEVRGGDETLCIVRDDEQIGAGAPLTGSVRDCPPGAGDVVYILQANCPDGMVYARRRLQVVP